MSPARPSDLADRLSDRLEPVVSGAGLHLEDVSVAAAGRRKVVRVVVDLPDGPGGLGSDRLSEVSREISGLLDDVDLLQGAYTLEVSTPGTDRPLTEPRHFRRSVGRLVALTTAEGVLTGRLTEAGETSLVLDVDGTAQEVAYDDVRRGQVQVELNRPDDV